MDKNTILTICVNYNNEAEVINFVKELNSQRDYKDQKIVVADNSDKEIPSNSIKNLQKNKNVLVYHSGKNLGYFGGAYWGMQQYLKEFPFPDWTIVCNTDIHFPDKGFFVRLNNFHKDNPPAVVAPDIILETEGSLPSSCTHQNPNMTDRPSRMRMHLYKWVFRYYPVYVLWEVISSLRYKIINTSGSRKQQQDFVDKPLKIYAPFGAFIIFNKSYFKAGGTLQHGTFLFGEEIFVAETVRRLNLDVIYDPRLRIIHREHSSMTLLNLRKKALYAHKAAAYCADTFFAGN